VNAPRSPVVSSGRGKWDREHRGDWRGWSEKIPSKNIEIPRVFQIYHPFAPIRLKLDDTNIGKV
jgi:hypothetical protein